MWAYDKGAKHQITENPNFAGDLVVKTRLNTIFYRGSDGGIHAVYWGGSSWIRTPIGNLNSVEGSLAVDRYRHDVYYLGTDSRLWILFWDGGS